MSGFLQLILITASILTVAFMLRKIRKSQVKIDDSLFWIYFSLCLFTISLFPTIPIFLAKLLEIESAANFIFLAIIFVLLVKQFFITIKISKLEQRLQLFIQRTALDQYENEKAETYITSYSGEE